ncbi:MAG TPA: winged helix-turn-helix domain-containing protein [Gaiellaceae bacterium]|nr:winged helix-turn-helix domain-containing protein [Gaiellaceae bacterium]
MAGSAFETLVALFARSDSELWLHLLGLALERPDDIVGAVRACPGDELRRHAVGVHVPAWQALVGLEALEATARGDTRLLDHECYYAGKARASLEAILPLSPEETKRWILGELELVRLDQELLAALERDAAAKRALALGAEEAIDLAAGGYRYEREPDMDRIVLVPHAAARPWLLLCQHDRTRIICYPLPEETSVEERAVALGRALGDDGRVRMLRRLARGDATLAELATEAGLAKSTAHHHLAQLRAAGLVTMHGNARGYRFTLRGDGVAAAHEILTRLTAP